MKKTKFFRRSWAILLALVMLAGTLTMTAFADNLFQDDFHILAGDIVTQTVVEKGGVISTTCADFQFLRGNFYDGSKLAPFTVFEGNGDGGARDTVGSTNDVNYACRWQWRTSENEQTILKITAKENVRFHLNQVNDISGELQWAFDSTYFFVVENAEGDRVTAREMPVIQSMTRDYIDTVIHLAKGETLYIVYAIVNNARGTATSHFMPYFEFDPAAYDASQKTDFSVAEALRSARTEKTEALNQTLTDMLGDGSVYSDDNAAALEEIVEKTIAGFNMMSSADDIIASYNAAIEEMNGVPTLAAQHAELEAFRAQAKDELAALVQQSDYTAENWKTVQNIITKANADIDAADSTSGVSRVLAYAKADINKIEKSEQLPAPEAPNAGIWVAIAAAAVVVAAVIVVVVVLVKKKKTEK